MLAAVDLQPLSAPATCRAAAGNAAAYLRSACARMLCDCDRDAETAAASFEPRAREPPRRGVDGSVPHCEFGATAPGADTCCESPRADLVAPPLPPSSLNLEEPLNRPPLLRWHQE